MSSHPDLLRQLSRSQRDKLKKVGRPRWQPPMLATLTDQPFSDQEWIYERKLDGMRVLAYIQDGKASLYSRRHEKLNRTFPEMAKAVGAAVERDAVLDGEIVTFSGRVTDFQKLQPLVNPHMQKPPAHKPRLWLYLFDLIHWDQWDLARLPLRTRKILLKQAVSFAGPLRFTPHRNQTGEAYFEEARRKGWEGLIAKNATACYQHNRSRDWLKFKCANRQEFVIGGFTDPQGQRTGLGALLVGVYQGEGLHYAGKVGTGFDEQTLASLRQRLQRMERQTSPFTDDTRERAPHWVTPSLVCELGFTEWTRDGKLRHPRFLGLRTDKAANEVIREQAEEG